MKTTVYSVTASAIERAGKSEADVEYIVLRNGKCSYADFRNVAVAENWEYDVKYDWYSTSYALNGLTVVGGDWFMMYRQTDEYDVDMPSYAWSFYAYAYTDASDVTWKTCSEMLNIEEEEAPAELIEYNSISHPGRQYLMMGRMFAHVFHKEATREQLRRLGPYVAKLMKPTDKITVFHKGQEMKVNYYPPSCYGKLKKVVGDFIA